MNVFLKQIKIYKNMINYKLSWYSLAYSGIPWHSYLIINIISIHINVNNCDLEYSTYLSITLMKAPASIK